MYFRNYPLLIKNRILFDEIDPEKTPVPPAPKLVPDPIIPPKAPKKEKEPFNGIDLSPVMERIEAGFKELNEKLVPPTPPAPPKKEKSYKIGDEFDLFPEV